MQLSFEGKHYIIIGANSGIGYGLSKMLAEENCSLLLVSKHTENLYDLSKHKSNISILQTDLENPENITLIFEYLKENHIVTDGMIYCAGLSPLEKLSDFRLQTALSVYNVNVFSFLNACKYFMDENYTSKNSNIVVISSNAAIYGGNRQALYASSKAALNIIVKSLAKELAARGIRINSVMPSITNTAMVANLRKQSDAIDLNVKYRMPFGILDTNDICNVICFLLSEKSSGISGTCVKINNGEAY